MDKMNLIDLDCSNVDNFKLVSPLIPNPVESGDKCVPVKCDFEYNNPFDQVLRNITNSDDSFERVYETVDATSSKLCIVENDKENYTHLVSPIQTPQRIRKSKVLSKNPLSLDISICKSTQKSLDVSTNVLEQSANESNASLQCLSETFMNEMNGSFGVALEIPLPDISNEQDTINKPSYLSNLSQNLHNNLIIPSINIFNENKSEPSDSGNSILNQAFLHSKNIENARMLKLSTTSSTDSFIRAVNSLTFDSLDTSENIENARMLKLSTTSSIYSFIRAVNSLTFDSLGTSELSCSSPDIDCSVDWALLKSITTDSSANTHVYTFNNQRKCVSAQKPPRKEQNLQLRDKTKFISLNNSFSGFNLNNQNESSSSLDDSVFLEARNLGHAFHTVANDTSELANEISVFAPPCMTDDIDLCDQDTEEIEAIVDVPTHLPQGNDIQEKEISAQSNSVRDNTQIIEKLKKILYAWLVILHVWLMKIIMLR